MAVPTPFRAQGFAFFLFAAVAASAQPAADRIFAARAEQAFARAQKQFADHPGDASAAWQLGRASYDWAEFATNTTQRADIAQAGIGACQRLIARDPKSAPGHYYLAMDFGELAEAEEPSLAAYKLIKDIEREFKTAADLDEKFDFAGPTRCLGLLYRDAPGWPVSIGNKRKAREWLDRAAALAPDFPENQLNLAESHLRWHQAADAEKALKKLEAIWPVAKTNLTGETWEPSWADWTARRTAVKNDFQKTFKRAPAVP
jgi:tetratricopeptide (TPR) repeat protein